MSSVNKIHDGLMMMIFPLVSTHMCFVGSPFSSSAATLLQYLCCSPLYRHEYVY